MLGVVRIHDGDLTFADMPGLIEDAHKGRGLGDEFLRHIERTKILLHIVDIAQGEGRDSFGDYESINRELRLYGRHLAKKTQVVGCNKMDLPQAKGNLDKFRKKINTKIFPISAVTGEGIKELLGEISNAIQENRN